MESHPSESAVPQSSNSAANHQRAPSPTPSNATTVIAGDSIPKFVINFIPYSASSAVPGHRAITIDDRRGCVIPESDDPTPGTTFQSIANKIAGAAGWTSYGPYFTTDAKGWVTMYILFVYVVAEYGMEKEYIMGALEMRVYGEMTAEEAVEKSWVQADEH
jgi:hypothetical protein